MIHRFFHSLAIGAVAVGAVAGSSGCASSPDAGATVASMNTFGVELAKVKDSIDDTVQALEAVVGTEAGDIRVHFEAYSKSLAALDRQAKVVGKRAEEMRALGDEFFKEWETPEDVSPERRAALNASYTRIEEDTILAKDQFTPFLQALEDIESYLELDLSLTGIHSLGELTKKAKDNGAKVKTSIDAALVQLNSVRGMLSTK